MMRELKRTTVVAVLAGATALGGCQAYLPRDETPALPPAFAVEVPRGPSSQRLDEDGYPVLGRFPGTATAQADPAVVGQTQTRFANVAARAGGGSRYGQTVSDLSAVSAAQRRQRTGEYQQSVEELRAIAADQRSSAAAD